MLTQAINDHFRDQTDTIFTTHLYRATIAQTPSEIQTQLTNLESVMNIHNATTGSITVGSTRESSPSTRMDILYESIYHVYNIIS